MKRHFLTALVAAAGTAFFSAEAKSDIDFVYRPSELSTEAGREKVLKRIARTAKMECRTVPVLPTSYYGARRECEFAIANDLVASIDNERLSARWREVTSD